MNKKMKAIVLKEAVEIKDINIDEIKIPGVSPGWVLIKVKAFGMNHSELILRKEEIKYDYIKKPVIPGIEAVGEIVDPSDSDFKTGDKVIAMMGGMGRSFDGSYAEYALVPSHHLFKIDSDLTWEELGAIPETYFTAWGSLFESLNLKADDSLLIRGASCALGYAAIQIAKALDCKVTATTHKEKYLKALSEADEVLLDDGKLTGKVSGINKILDLVGPKNLLDSLTAVDKGGIVCQTGILGGIYSLNNFDPIKDIPNGVYLTGFYSNYPTQGTVNDMFSFFNKHNLKPHYGAVYKFSNIKEAMQMQESGKAGGKIIVLME
ncbi:alcohol dehydrogenase catalytic domain-containing protein [Lachnospiraceae bacterium C1.1]|nr:zinc-binding dehydrogenase [Lachnospiraceae bacterium C1.1]